MGRASCTHTFLQLRHDLNGRRTPSYHRNGLILEIIALIPPGTMHQFALVVLDSGDLGVLPLAAIHSSAPVRTQSHQSPFPLRPPRECTHFKIPLPFAKISHSSSKVSPSGLVTTRIHFPFSSSQVALSTLCRSFMYLSRSNFMATSLKYCHISGAEL